MEVGVVFVALGEEERVSTGFSWEVTTLRCLR